MPDQEESGGSMEETPEQNPLDAAIERAREECHDLWVIASDSDRRYATLPDLPAHAAAFGEAIEKVKQVQSLITEHRTALSDAADELKAAHADFLRGSKQALSEKDKRDLAARLDADTYYTKSVAVAEGLAVLWRQWDARRSRLNRDFEVAKIRFEHEMRTNAADYAFNRGKELADYEHRRRMEIVDEEFKLRTAILDREGKP